MKVTNIVKTVSNNKVRLSAELIFNKGKRHEIFFETDKEFEKFVITDGSPFLAAALPVAMINGENLEVEESVSEMLFKNTSKIKKLYQKYFNGFKSISLKAKSVHKDSGKARSVGLFFSGGVDSFYSYLKNAQKIDYLIFVHGFDIPLKEEELYKKLEKNILKIAKSEKVKLIKVRTNIRETFEWYLNWDQSHTFAINSIALFLRGGLKEIFASCGLANKKSGHNNMKPELDKLYATEIFKLNHFGCIPKIAKFEFVGKHDLALNNLRICWTNPNGEYNCCECEKCFRSMLALYLSGSLKDAKTFKKGLNLRKLRSMRFKGYTLEYFKDLLNEMIKRNDLSEVRFALEECIQKSSNPSLLLNVETKIREYIRYLDKTYNRNRFYWFLARRGLV